jgi:DMSO reductase family type II enzyme heme b subunit
MTTVIKAVRLQLANRTLLNEAAPQWAKAPAVNIALRGTEAQLQPSPYVRTAWAGKHIGAVRTLRVQAAHNRQHLFFRLEWPDPTHNPDYGDGSAFPDAAAVLFPRNGHAPITRMGAPGEGIEAWYWRANRGDAGEALAYEGFATEKNLLIPVIHSADWRDGRWRLVVGAPLAPETPGRVGFAVWDGGSQERAGLHSLTADWLPLGVEALKEAAA